jgi:hypothetical protein
MVANDITEVIVRRGATMNAMFIDIANENAAVRDAGGVDGWRA